MKNKLLLFSGVTSLILLVYYFFFFANSLEIEKIKKEYIGEWNYRSGIANVKQIKDKYSISYNSNHCKMDFTANVYLLDLNENERIRVFRMYDIDNSKCPYINTYFNTNNLVFKINDNNEKSATLTFFSVKEIKDIIELTDLNSELKGLFNTLLFKLEKVPGMSQFQNKKMNFNKTEDLRK